VAPLEDNGVTDANGSVKFTRDGTERVCDDGEQSPAAAISTASRRRTFNKK
jgi:hypothetical protein